MVLLQIACHILTLAMHFKKWDGATPYCGLCKRRGEHYLDKGWQMRCTWWRDPKDLG